MINDTRDRQSVYRRPIRRRGFDTLQTLTGEKETTQRQTRLQNLKQFKVKYGSYNDR